LLLDPHLTSLGTRPGDEGQQRRRRGVADANGLHLEEEEFRGERLVQPGDGPYMLGSWIADDPDGGVGFERREVGDQLAEMIVVTSLELVLDHDGVAGLVLADEVNVEASSRPFALDVADGDAEGVTENICIVLQPRREVERLVPPNLTEPYPSDLPDVPAGLKTRPLGNTHRHGLDRAIQARRAAITCRSTTHVAGSRRVAPYALSSWITRHTSSGT